MSNFLAQHTHCTEDFFAVDNGHDVSLGGVLSQKVPPRFCKIWEKSGCSALLKIRPRCLVIESIMISRGLQRAASLCGLQLGEDVWVGDTMMNQRALFQRTRPFRQGNGKKTEVSGLETSLHYRIRDFMARGSLTCMPVCVFLITSCGPKSQETRLLPQPAHAQTDMSGWIWVNWQSTFERGRTCTTNTREPRAHPTSTFPRPSSCSKSHGGPFWILPTEILASNVSPGQPALQTFSHSSSPGTVPRCPCAISGPTGSAITSAVCVFIRRDAAVSASASLGLHGWPAPFSRVLLSTAL
mmetsp:Transcript_21385/g.33929  ORF Transcript_21385/g.33929 Transcript_21385/m.33929 type:complete len:298 (+) Transcript_21385:1077-1970(+)